MIPEGSLLTGQYNLLAVAFSILIAILGAYVGLDLAAQVRASQGRARRAWLTGSTLAMGIAIWSMHYTGMLAFHLSVPVRYHVPTTVLSFLIAIVGSAIGCTRLRARNSAGALRPSQHSSLAPGLWACITRPWPR